VLLFPFKQGHVDLKALFKALAKKGIQRILVEGGPTLANMSLALGLVDRIHIYIAPRLMTGVPREDMIAGVDVGRLINEDKLDILDVKRTGRDIFIDAMVRG
jgi:diaminohydroxyphosphoribosylaminopyrimidine deaminase / 5-amino-6-(5-phosphoribosylamino)uracil reductase